DYHPPPARGHPYPTRRSSDLLVQPLQEAGEAADPAERIVDRELRPGAKVRIAGIGRRRQAAVASIVVGEAKPGRVRTEQRCEHKSEEHTSELQSLAYLVCRLL